jgi:hypothetical protein
MALYRWPFFVLLALLLLLGWEIVRVNLSPHDRHGLPFSLTFLGVDTTAVLAGGLASLLLARAQFAFVNRPLLGAGSDGVNAGIWSVKLFNGGPGHASVYDCTYSLVVSKSANGNRPSVERGDYDAAYAFLLSIGLKEEHDFWLRRLSPGAPLPPAGSASQGIELFALTEQTFPTFDKFVVIVRVVDIVGDQHEWTRDFAEVFRSI